ncbi:Uncharacterised protein [Mycobacteroides abscessus subsp. abscessus]|nr:Uncharacterised protein [Mycobacteroides abscessus subsp. abscessus]
MPAAPCQCGTLGDVRALGTDVRDEHGSRSEVGTRHHRTRIDSGHGVEDGLDLSRLDALSTDLDLEVGPSEIVQTPIVCPPDQIAGSVHPSAIGPERVGDESFRGQPGTTDITVGQLDTGEVELTRDTDRNLSQGTVEDMNPSVGHRRTDGHRTVVAAHRALGDIDRRLGGAVEIDQISVRSVDHPLGETPRKSLT